MLLPLAIAGRLLQRRGTPLLRTSALAALVAVALGMASLVVVLALMNGYREALRAGILAGGGHAVAMFPAGLVTGDGEALRARLLGVRGVRAVGEVLYLPALLLTGGSTLGAETVTLKASGLAAAFAPAPEEALSGPLPVAVGSGLARRLSLAEGAAVSLQVMGSERVPRGIPARVARVFHTGLAELDDHWVAARVASLARRLPEARPNGVEIELDDADAALDRRDEIAAAAGRAALVTTWQDTNANLFAALRWQKISLGVLLSLVVGVGAFEVASALVVLVTEKRRQLGILMALGGEPRLLRATVLAAAGSLGVAGVLAGTALGVAIAKAMTALGVPSFPPEIAAIYMVERIPFIVEWGDIGIVVTLGFAEVLLAALLPARRVARWQPSEVLRWV